MTSRPKFVAHAVAPRYTVLDSGSHKPLSMAHLCSIDLAIEAGAKRIVFPSLGTGNFGFPIESAPLYALDGLGAAFREGSTLERITICCFTEEDAVAYRRALTP